jgi:putative spermidine/putrescine transport system ATP-binding protein/putrescine transport system ATP-binding protein
MSAIDFRGVTKLYGAVTAIAGVSFTVEAGETIALLGPSGCGKTTILRLIAGFEQPDEGTITIGGRVMGGLKPYERNVGLVFQNYALFPHMTVAQNVAYGLRHRGHPMSDIPARVAAMLDLVRLSEFGGRRPDQLSGGQQQRVALARALATSPSLLLLDEPLSALDAKLRHDLRTELKQMLAAAGSTVIVVTHDQEEAMSLGERVFVMSRGSILQTGTPNDVYWRPNSRFVAEFMGRANWLAGEIGRDDAGVATFRSRFGWSLPVVGADVASGPAALCIRPESVELTETDARGGALSGRVVDVVPLGPVRQIILELAGGERLIAAEPNRAGRVPARGEAVGIAIPSSACVFFPATA